MYMELDGDDIAVTYIKDVSFNTNRPDVDVLKMTKVREGKHFYFVIFMQSKLLCVFKRGSSVYAETT